MESLKRLKVVLFALMIFGAFANFAQNEWGIGMIIICEALIALTFLGELIQTLIKRIKKKERTIGSYIKLGCICTMFLTLMVPLFSTSPNSAISSFAGWVFVVSGIALILAVIADSIYSLVKKSPPQYIYENFFLFIFFFGMVGKNNSWPGSAPALIFSCGLLLPYYLNVIIKFFKENYSDGKPLISVLSVGSFAGVLLSLSFVFKTMHWPFATTMFYVSLSLTCIMIIGTLKWNYVFKGEKISILKGMSLLKTNIVLIYFMAFTYCFYIFLNIQGLAPKFYSQDYPEAVDKLKSNGFDGEKKAQELRNAYNNFFSHAVEKGFLK